MPIKSTILTVLRPQIPLKYLAFNASLSCESPRAKDIQLHKLFHTVVVYAKQINKKNIQKHSRNRFTRL